jgi:hypothetical protein
MNQSEWNAEGMARAFHETYERLAPGFGYKTRTETRRFDPTSPNGKLMIAVCQSIINGYIVPAERALIERMLARADVAGGKPGGGESA